MRRVINIVEDYNPGNLGNLSKPLKCTKPIKILIADDQVINRMVIKMFLENAGHWVQEVSNGLDAIRELENRSYDIVLMDINMPILNGIDAATKFRKDHPAKATLPIVALTADMSADIEQRCHNAGMTMCVKKTIGRVGLLEIIATLTASIQSQASDKTTQYTHLNFSNSPPAGSNE